MLDLDYPIVFLYLKKTVVLAFLGSRDIVVRFIRDNIVSAHGSYTAYNRESLGNFLFLSVFINTMYYSFFFNS